MCGCEGVDWKRLAAEMLALHCYSGAFVGDGHGIHLCSDLPKRFTVGGGRGSKKISLYKKHYGRRI